MHFNIVTLFPEFFHSPLSCGLMARGVEGGLVGFSLVNPRDFTQDRHRTVDDRPYGGGPGMVMMLDPLARALRALDAAEAADAQVDQTDQTDQTGQTGQTGQIGQDRRDGQGANSADMRMNDVGVQRGRILVLSPSGRPLDQAMARELSREQALTLVCGRYEGIDARLGELFDIEEVSVGDFVLNGGEAGALCLIEAVSRLVPGFMGHEDSGEEESFSSGLLEYPHYTRPEEYDGIGVPEVLTSGDHGRIARWRRERALEKTLFNRPDLLPEARLDDADADYLRALTREGGRVRIGRNLFLALLHHPVVNKAGKVGTVSLTNLDIHDIARVSRTNGLGGYYLVTPIEDQRRMIVELTGHWVAGHGKSANPDRAEALSGVRGCADLDEAIADIARRTGTPPRLIATSARGIGDTRVRDVRSMLEDAPVLLVMGTASGLAPEVLERAEGTLRPVRWLDGYNHLSVRSATSILVDRLLGDAD